MEGRSAGKRGVTAPGPFNALCGCCRVVCPSPAYLTGSRGLQRQCVCGCADPGTSTATALEATTQLSLTSPSRCLFSPIPHPPPAPPESMTGASRDISGAAAALASSTLDLSSSQTGSKASGKPASVQHNSSSLLLKATLIRIFTPGRVVIASSI